MQEKQVLVEPRVIDLNTYFMDDDDWLAFWGVTRYITSFLIYISLIVMFYNKYKGIIGGSKVVINNYSSTGDLGRRN